MERDSTTSPEHGWYIAEPDGTTFGPFTRGEFAAQRQRGGFSGEALAWHVDFAEWRPLSRIAMSGPTRAGEASRERAATHVGHVAAQAQARAKPTKAERKAMRAAAQAASGGGREAATTAVDDGRRLLQGAALARAAARPASAPAAAPTLPGKGAPAAAAAAENAARAGLAVRRFVARILDTLTLGMLVAAVGYGFAWRELPQIDVPNPALLAWLAVFAMVPVGALSLAFAGRTPGKWLLALETRTPGGAKPALATALQREIDVLWRGMGLGIPVFGLITAIVGGATYVNQGETTWDKRTRLTTRSAGAAKWQPALIALVAALYLLSTGFWLQLVMRIVTLE